MAVLNVILGGLNGYSAGKLISILKLPVEILYNEYQFAAAFAVASLLTVLALVMLAVKTLIEWQARQTRRAALAVRGETEG